MGGPVPSKGQKSKGTRPRQYQEDQYQQQKYRTNKRTTTTTTTGDGHGGPKKIQPHPKTEREKGILGSYKKLLRKTNLNPTTREGVTKSLASPKSGLLLDPLKQDTFESEQTIQNPKATTPASGTGSKRQLTRNRQKPSAFNKAKNEFSRQKRELEEKRQAKIKLEAEREATRQKRKAIKLERHKAISQKTKYGQPKMGPRMQLLLNKIQEDCKTSK